MKLFLTAIMSFVFLTVFAQKKEKVQILNADKLTYSEKNNKAAQKLIGNVQLKHQDALMFCDSAYLYKETNNIEAFGNVRITQGDTLSLSGNYLKYDSELRQADVKKNVQLVRPDITLSTEQILLDRKTNIAYYTSGGTIVSNKDNNVLYSRKGYYYINEDIFYFKDSVKLNNPDYKMYSDTMKYWTTTEEVFFYGPTEIIGKDNYIYCENGYYNTLTEKSKFFKNAYLISDKQKLLGDTLTYDRTKAYGEARCNVKIIDTAENITVSGELAKYYERKDSAEVSIHSLLTQPFDEDTLFMHAHKFKVYPDSSGQRVMQAYYKVQFYKSDMQGSCDSVAYALTDSTLKMYYSPVIWSDQNQITGKEIDIRIKKGKVHQLFIPENAFIISEELKEKYNQIKGKKLTGYFKENDLRKVLIEGNGQTIYYGKDGDDKLIGVNKAESTDLLIQIKDNDIQSITFVKDPDATLYPLNELNPDDLLLDGFKWLIEYKPMDAHDIFIWKRGEIRK